VHERMKRLRAIIENSRVSSAYRYFTGPMSLQRRRRRFWKWSAEDQKRLEFYRQFVNAGDLVFDVGANRGNRAKVFTRLGAVVVAVEPQTACADYLRAVFKNIPTFHLEKKALGDSVGQGEMLISSAHTLSSLSHDWVRSVKASGRFAGNEWNRSEIVPIDTLDNLIALYGRPAFVKIDVEGFEYQVVSGLSAPVRALSMEFTPECIDNTLKCVAYLGSIGDFRFQICPDESMEFLLPRWVTGQKIGEALSAFPSTAFGDLYARLTAH